MIKIRNPKHYDLEDRTSRFAKKVAEYVGKLSLTVAHNEYGRQLIRSGSSVGANYIEANESLGKKDFLLRIKICRKEAKEARYWLQLTEPVSIELATRAVLVDEATELMKIFGAILEKSK